jgi:uncharacterized damage-inducible protein DinB
MMSRELIDRYDAGGPILAYATQGLTREQESARPGPGAWSVAQLVAHVLDTDLVFAERMKRVIAEDRPTLIGFEENLWVDRLHSDAMAVEEAVNLFVANRRWMTRVLKACDTADFGRKGVHTERGEQTLAEILVYIANHLDHHLKFLYGKRGNLGVALYPRYTVE